MQGTCTRQALCRKTQVNCLVDVENCHFGKSFFFLFFISLFFLLSLVFSSFIRFILPRCCWSFVVLCSLVLFLSFLSFSCPLVCYISVGNSLIYACLFLREVIFWSVFPVSALCPAEDLPKIIMFIVPDRGQRGWQQ